MKCRAWLEQKQNYFNVVSNLLPIYFYCVATSCTSVAMLTPLRKATWMPNGNETIRCFFKSKSVQNLSTYAQQMPASDCWSGLQHRQQDVIAIKNSAKFTAHN